MNIILEKLVIFTPHTLCLKLAKKIMFSSPQNAQENYRK